MSRKRRHDEDASEEDVFVYYADTDLDSIPSGITSLRIDSSVKEIPTEAFCEQSSLTNVEFQEGLEVIGFGAFYNCTSLRELQFPSTLIEIDERAFLECKQLQSLGRLPLSLKIVRGNAFACCFQLRNFELLNNTIRLEEDVFIACYGLTHLDFSRSTITSIGCCAFLSCENLKSVVLPRTNLKRIEMGCFVGCPSLTHLWVPPTVEYIDRRAIVGCHSLLSLEVPETLKRFIFVYEDLDYGNYCGYESLVNIYLPPSHQLVEVSNYGFMEQIKLREAESSYPELVGKLKRRFDSLPLHRACYFQSYHSLQENISRIRSITTAGQGECERIDFLGMTPFHILALSQRPWLGLFQELLSVSSVDIMKCRDVFGSTPLDYLCKNHSSAAMSVTKSLLVFLLEPRISFLRLDCWRDDVVSALENVQMADASSLGAKVMSVCQKLAKLELMEGLSSLEMSIWRMKMEEEKAVGSDGREKSRINCGSSIVLENVIPFLEAEY